MLVNPTSEEYKYLGCGNTSDEVLEFLFSIPFSLSEVLFASRSAGALHGSGKALNSRRLQLLPHPMAAVAPCARHLQHRELSAAQQRWAKMQLLPLHLSAMSAEQSGAEARTKSKRRGPSAEYIRVSPGVGCGVQLC